jgi:ABC-type transporter Mla subunit MlaD
MSETRRNVIVGLFVVIAMALFGVLTFWFGESPEFVTRIFGSAKYPISIYFDHLTGVDEGAEVRMAVGTVGHVDRIGFRDALVPGKGIEVVAMIYEGVSVPSNAVAVVVPPAMFGRAYIVLTSPAQLEPAPPLPTDGSGRLSGRVAGVLDSIIPEGMLTTLDRATGAIGNLADAMTPVAADLHNLLEERPSDVVDHPPPGMSEVTANLYTAVERLDRTLRHLDEVVGNPETQNQVKTAIENMHAMSADGKATFERAREFSMELQGIADEAHRVLANLDITVQNTEQRLDVLAHKLIDTTDLMSALLQQLHEAAYQLNSGEGTAAMLLRDPRLYEEMTLTFERLSSLAVEIEGALKDIQTRGLKTRL